MSHLRGLTEGFAIVLCVIVIFVLLMPPLFWLLDRAAPIWHFLGGAYLAYVGLFH